MKAEIVNGALVLAPENETEMFAISCWFDKSVIKYHRIDPANLETECIKGSSIKVSSVVLDANK